MEMETLMKRSFASNAIIFIAQILYFISRGCLADEGFSQVIMEGVNKLRNEQKLVND